jgi:hypothetical protein
MLMTASFISCIDMLIQSLYDGMDSFILHDERSIDKYLGVSITQLDNLSFSFMQPFLIDCISALLGIDYGRTKEHFTPVGKPILNKDLMGVT